MNSMVIGIDLGDKQNCVCVLDYEGAVVESCNVQNTMEKMQEYFSSYRGVDTLAVMEAGSGSAWVSHLLEAMGLEVLVCDPRRVKALWSSKYKTDGRDAEMLARIGRADRTLLCPVEHRSAEAQADLVLIKSRDLLVRQRSSLINHLRSMVKVFGCRLPACSAASFHHKAVEHVPHFLEQTLGPMFGVIEGLTNQIKKYDKEIERVSAERYPEVWRLRQVTGVGPLTALAFVLVIEDARRFKKSRHVGPYIGLVPRCDQSGQCDKQLRITKSGNTYLRQLLVNCAHYILGPFGPDCDLRRFGEKLCARGGKNAKRRAVVAVARKLSVLLHRLWVSGEKYEPFYVEQKQKAA